MEPEPPKPLSLPEQLEKMRRDWDERARENARHYVANSREEWTDEEFFASGEETVARFILNDPGNIYQGRDPASMRVLEIGCGAGRVTHALSKLFGEVHAVDVSGEMIAQARAALAHRPNVHLYQNNGCDLSVVPPLEFDFAYSTIVFQHIPSYQIIENYVREVHRLLRQGGLFKFTVQGYTGIDLPAPDDTWNGVAFSEEQAREMALRCGFEPRYNYGAGEQEFVLWFFKSAAKVLSPPGQLEKMRRDWDERARENARHYVENSREEWSDEAFFASGEETVARFILNDPGNIYQGRDPAAMRVLEIGCGAGRVTNALSKLFGEVHAVDVSAEMIARARAALAHRPNVHLYQNNGCDLSVIPPMEFDFAFSFIVFQHIPSYDVIENYVREVHRLLRPGGLFKFQVQGSEGLDVPASDETWEGVAISQAQATEMAQRCGFECRYSHGAGTVFFWLWFFKPATF